MSDELLSLFILDTVLFPTMQIPLQVFEPRYLKMIERCLKRDEPFGINLMKSSGHSFEPSEPYRVGVTARIVSHQRQPDGRILLVAVGEERYRVLEFDASKDYLRARVQYLEEEPFFPNTLETGKKVLVLFKKVLEEMGLGLQFDAQLPEQPDRISYLVASHLNRDSLEKQRILENDRILERLEQEEQWLLELFESVKLRKKVEEIAGRNGKIHH